MFVAKIMTWLAVGGLAIVLAPRVAGADGAKADAEKLLGTWKMVSGDRGGKPPPAEMLEKFRVTFKADGKMSITTRGDREEEGTYQLDGGKKPKEITMKSSEGMAMYAIYTFDGDKLQICGAEEEGDRPKEFASKEGSRAMNMIFEKVKDK